MNDDELAAELRRDLAGVRVPLDAARADDMARAAAREQLLDARSHWVAPVAAAAAVLVIGGGAAVVAATRSGGDDGTPAGGVPSGGCPSAVASPPAAASSAVAPSPRASTIPRVIRTAVPLPTMPGTVTVTAAPSQSPTPTTAPTPTSTTSACGSAPVPLLTAVPTGRGVVIAPTPGREGPHETSGSPRRATSAVPVETCTVVLTTGTVSRTTVTRCVHS